MQLLSAISGFRNGLCSFSTKENVNQIQVHHPDSQSQLQLTFLKTWAPPLFTALVFLSPTFYDTPVCVGETMEIPRGASLFRQACIGCHSGGGNIIQPGATLFAEDLVRNGVETEEDIFRITYYGKGRMPGFGEKCSPRGQCTFGPRLLDEEIKLLAQVVRQQADQNWKSLDIYSD